MDFSISHLSYIVGVDCVVAFLAILIFKAQVNDLKNVINSIHEAAFSKGSSVEGYIFEAENYSIPYQLLTLRKIISKESLVAAEFMLLEVLLKQILIKLYAKLCNFGVHQPLTMFAYDSYNIY